MIDVPELRRLYRVKRFDFWIAAAAFLGVLSAGVLAGVVIGIALSLVWLVYVATAPGDAAPRPRAGHQVFRDMIENPDDETFPGIAVLRLDGGLFFATAEALEERVRALVQQRDAARPRRCARPRRREPDRLPGSREARRDPRLRREHRGRVAPRPRQARRRSRAREGRRPRPPRRRRIHGNVHRAVEAELAAERTTGRPGDPAR